MQGTGGKWGDRLLLSSQPGPWASKNRSMALPRAAGWPGSHVEFFTDLAAPTGRGPCSTEEGP